MTFIQLETEHSSLQSTVKVKVITKVIVGIAKGSFRAPHKLHIDIFIIIYLFVSFNMS